MLWNGTYTEKSSPVSTRKWRQRETQSLTTTYASVTNLLSCVLLRQDQRLPRIHDSSFSSGLGPLLLVTDPDPVAANVAVHSITHTEDPDGSGTSNTLQATQPWALKQNIGQLYQWYLCIRDLGNESISLDIMRNLGCVNPTHSLQHYSRQTARPRYRSCHIKPAQLVSPAV